MLAQSGWTALASFLPLGELPVDSVVASASVSTSYHGAYIEMEAQIKKWGNSLALRIPKSVARQLALEVDCPVGLSCEGATLTIRPLKRRLRLGDLLEQVSDANRHGEVQTGGPVGEEAW